MLLRLEYAFVTGGRRASEGDSLVAACPGWTPPSIRANPFGICSPRIFLPQLLYYLHLRAPLGSEDSKALTPGKWLAQLLFHQHLRHTLGSVAIKGLITPLESAFTKISTITPLECALIGNRRRGVMVNQERERTTLRLSSATKPGDRRSRDTCLGALMIKATPLRSRRSGFEVEFSFGASMARSHSTFRRIA